MSRTYSGDELPLELRAIVSTSCGVDQYTLCITSSCLWRGPNHELVVSPKPNQYHVLPRGTIVTAASLPYGIPQMRSLNRFTCGDVVVCAADVYHAGRIERAEVIMHSRALTARQRRMYYVDARDHSLLWMQCVTGYYLLNAAGVCPRSARVVAQRYQRAHRTRLRYGNCDIDSAALRNIVRTSAYVVMVRKYHYTQAHRRRMYGITTWNPCSRIAAQWKLAAHIRPSMVSSHIGTVFCVLYM